MSHIPLVDLKAQHQQVAEEVESGFARVLADTSFIMGKDVAEFEEHFAHFVGVRHCVAVANGTDSLELGLRALGLEAGDEVILPANTFVATALAVVRAGARPVLVDCDPVHHLIDPDQVEARIGERTRAIVPVHLYGQMAPMEALEELAGRAGIPILEDAAQAQGAERHGRSAGAVGRVAGTSFYPGKNLGAYGDAGAVLTQDDDLAGTVRALRNYGGERKYEHPELGFNSRMDTLQAVVLNAKLPHLAGWNELRRQAARLYHRLLEPLEWVQRPETLAGNQHVWHLYVVRVSERDEILQRLHDAQVGAGVHYPKPVHLLEAFRSLGLGRGAFPRAEEAADQVLSLPLYPGIGEEQQARVVEELASARG